MQKILLLYIILSIFLVGCGMELGKNPDAESDTTTKVETSDGSKSTTVSIPIQNIDSSTLSNLLIIFGSGVLIFAALAIVFAAMWQRNSRGKRRKYIKKGRKI